MLPPPIFPHQATGTSASRAQAPDRIGPARIGILANVIQPGPIDTDPNPADGAYAANAHAQSALGRHGRPDEVAALR